MGRAKITVVGAGNVGASVAQRLVERGAGDVVLVDIPDLASQAQGKALDLYESTSVYQSSNRVVGGSDYGPSRDSDIVIITAGVARKPGMSRDDLLNINTGILRDVTAAAARHSPGAVLIVVSNPLDAMCYVALKVSGFPKNRVVGMAGILDSARMRSFIAEALSVSVENVSCMVLGGHGDTMVPLTRFCCVSGIPISELLSEEKIAQIVQRTRDGGAEIVKLLKTGSAYYAPSASVVEMAEAILYDQKKVLPCAAYLEGEYGLSGVYLGVPVKLGKGGLEQIVQLNLNVEERMALNKSAESVRELIHAMKL